MMLKHIFFAEKALAEFLKLFNFIIIIRAVFVHFRRLLDDARVGNRHDYPLFLVRKSVLKSE